MINPRTLALALLIAALPVGFAVAAGRGGGRALGGGVGAEGMGSAAVGGGAPGGQVGGGPPAGAVGGGSPNSSNPGGNGSAGTGNPSLNAAGGSAAGTDTNAPGIPGARTNIGGYGDSTGAPPASALPGGTSPEASSSQRSPTNDSTAARDLQGLAEVGPFSPTGLARPGPDGVSTVIVAARACGVAAHETDGTTTCIGIPASRPHRR
jgi:hypothetical protein